MNIPKEILDFIDINKKKVLNRSSKKNIKEGYFEINDPFYQVGCEFDYHAILNEAISISDEMISPSYGLGSSDEKGVYTSQGWELLVVHGLGKHKYNRANSYGYESESTAPYNWTEVASQCEQTVNFLMKLPYKKLHRAWFAVLRSGGYITPHVGRQFNNEFNHKMTFALNHPDGFSFCFDGGEVPWGEGRGFLLKVDSFMHGAVNLAAEDRYHLITMGEPDWERLQPMIIV